MIKINSTKGELNCRGPLDLILFEYTLLTRVILKEMREQFGEKTANELFAGLGQIAAKNVNDLHDVKSMMDEIDEVFPDEV